MLVYLIRHGETNQNKQRKLQGQSNYELNDYGRELAEKTRDALSNVTFDCAFSSPLIRALETASIIIGKRDIPIVEDIRIQEISFGDYEGLCCGKEGYNIPDPQFLNFFDAPEKYRIPPNGESFTEVIERTGEFWEELLQKTEYRDKTILISTHGCALKALLANIRTTEIENFWGKGVHKNCAVTIVRVENGKAEILEEGKVFY
ncbi:MAG: histidine phosphatase family protein [Lachnospiraceae bacterium]|nr:histidine phosphatase family protein [Lachnospiraceae bacterium]